MDHATNYDSIMNSFLSSAIIIVEDGVEGSRWICSFVECFVMHLLMGLGTGSRLLFNETIIVNGFLFADTFEIVYSETLRESIVCETEVEALEANPKLH